MTPFHTTNVNSMFKVTNQVSVNIICYDKILDCFMKKNTQLLQIISVPAPCFNAFIKQISFAILTQHDSFQETLVCRNMLLILIMII